MIRQSEKESTSAIASRVGSKKTWVKPGIQKIEVAFSIKAASLLKLDPTGAVS